MIALRYAVLLLAASLSPIAFGHHSGSAYGRGALRELQGEVVAVGLMSNPHPSLTIRTDGSGGSEERWKLEIFPGRLLLYRGVSRDAISVGDHIQVTGYVSARRERTMWVMRLTVGTDTLIRMGGEELPREREFDSREVGPSRLTTRESDRANVGGIFRVWSWARSWYRRANWLQNHADDWPEDFRLPDAAEPARLNWDLYVDDPARRCIPPGMPQAMTHNELPIEFVESDEKILLYLEQFDLIRTIHMTREPPGNQTATAPLGYSIGWWEDQTLVVRTTHVDHPFANRDGVLQSDEVQIVERFTLNNYVNRLSYSITVSDPARFAEPTVGTTWLSWTSGLEREEYDCSVLE